MGSSSLPALHLRSSAQCRGAELGEGLRTGSFSGAVCGLNAVCCAVSASTRPHNPCHVNTATSAQKGKDKKKAKYDSLQELRKNKKELEFEQKLYKEKEEMLEKEKQLKINRLAQEVCVLPRGQVSVSGHSLVIPHQAPREPAGVVFPKWSPGMEWALPFCSV